MTKRKNENGSNGSSPEGAEVKKSRVVAKKYWIFTWQGGEDGMGFDMDSDEWKLITRYFSLNSTHASMQEEKCPTTGRHHIQGFVAFTKKKRFPEVQELTPISWCHAATASEKSNKAYTTKSETSVIGGLSYTKGFTVLRNIITPAQIQERPWQYEIWNAVKDECTDDRTINWIFDEEGNHGKTALIKSIIHHHPNGNVLLFEGKTVDIANRIVNQREPPRVCLMNLRRSQDGHVNYNAIECLKDGLVSSGKYEGGQKIFDSPHVYIFSNFYPDTSKLSKDRWRIIKLENGGSREIVVGKRPANSASGVTDGYNHYGE